MQVGDLGAVVFVVKVEKQLILAFGHVIDRAGVGRVQNFLLCFTRRGGVDFDL